MQNENYREPLPPEALSNPLGGKVVRLEEVHPEGICANQYPLMPTSVIYADYERYAVRRRWDSRIMPPQTHPAGLWLLVIVWD